MSTCGTGNANLPLPGDPNTNTVVTVTNTALGLLVSWTYPSVNAGAVAHFQLHRSTSFSDANPPLHKIVTGDSYLDVKQDLTVGTTYFYWIRVVSVSGVIGPLQGPGSVTGESAIADIITAMSGQIRASELHNDLTTKIGILDTLKIQIDGSYLLTTPDYDALLASLADLNTANADLQVAIQDEITLRATNDGTLLTAIDALAIVDGDNAAAILAETNLRVSEDAVLAGQISTLQATLTHPTTGLTATGIALNNLEIALEATDDDVSAVVSEVDTLQATVYHPSTGLSAVGTVANQTKIDLEATDDEVSALVTQTDTLQAVVEHPDTGLAAVSSIAVNAEATADIAADGVVSLGSKYTVKLDSNGHVAGFGLANTPNLDNGSNTSAFEVNADRFSIGHPGSGDSDVPFYVVSGQTYITDAFIKNASITNAKIGNLAVTNAKISNLAVDTLKIADNAVTTTSVIVTSSTALSAGTNYIIPLTITMSKPGNALVVIHLKPLVDSSTTPGQVLSELFSQSPYVPAYSLGSVRYFEELNGNPHIYINNFELTTAKTIYLKYFMTGDVLPNGVGELGYKLTVSILRSFK